MLGPPGGGGPVQRRHGVGGGEALQQRAVVGAVRPERHLAVRAGAGHLAVVSVADGDGQPRPGNPDGAGAHAELAEGDPADAGEEPFPLAAERAGEGAVVTESAVPAGQQGLLRQQDLVEGGQAVVHRAAGALRERAHGDAGQGADPVGERREEEEDPVVAALDQQSGRDHSGFGTAGRAGVGHELLRAGVGGVQGEGAVGQVVAGGGLQRGGVVAVAQFGAQERADPLHGGVLGQRPFVVRIVVEQTAEEEVVVDARQHGERTVQRTGPLVQCGQPVGVGGQFGGVGQLVHPPQPLVRRGELVGRRRLEPAVHPWVGGQPPPDPVDPVSVGPEEEGT